MTPTVGHQTLARPMSELGQKAKYSLRADVFRYSPSSRHSTDRVMSANRLPVFRFERASGCARSTKLLSPLSSPNRNRTLLASMRRRRSALPAQSQKHHALVFVRLVHDRRFVGAVLFVLVLVLFVLIRISGRHRVAHDHEGSPVDQLGGKFLGDVWGHVVAPRVWTLGDFTPSAVIRPANLTPLSRGIGRSK